MIDFGFQDALLDSPHVTAAVYFLDAGHYLYRRKSERGEIASKCLAATDVAAAFSQRDIDSGWISPGVMRHGTYGAGAWFVFYAEPTRVLVRLSDEELEIPIPGIVLMGAGSIYYLWALQERFSPQARLYRAPFPNVYPDGRICFGGNQVPEAQHSHAVDIWRLFFATPFNGDLARGKSQRHLDDVRLMLAECAGKRAYPLKDLIQAGCWSVEREVNDILTRCGYAGGI